MYRKLPSAAGVVFFTVLLGACASAPPRESPFAPSQMISKNVYTPGYSYRDGNWPGTHVAVFMGDVDMKEDLIRNYVRLAAFEYCDKRGKWTHFEPFTPERKFSIDYPVAVEIFDCVTRYKGLDGVTVLDVEDAPEQFNKTNVKDGVWLRQVSASSQPDLRENDILTSIQGQKVSSLMDVLSLLEPIQATFTTADIIRRGESRSARIRFTDQTAEQKRLSLKQWQESCDAVLKINQTHPGQCAKHQGAP